MFMGQPLSRGLKLGYRTNILFVSSAHHIAGGEINLLALLDTIDCGRFKPYCLYNPASHFEVWKLQAGVSLSPFHFPVYSKKSVSSIVIAHVKLATILKRYKIGLIYINIAGDYKFFRPLSKILNIPVILHIHIDEPDEDLRWIKADCADRILFPSRATMLAVLKHSPQLESSKCFYVHNGVDLSKYYPRESKQLYNKIGLSENLPVIGIFGQLKRIKGQHLFLEMAKNLSYLGIKANFIIVGKDTTTLQGEYEERLKKMARDLGVKDLVHFLGFRSDIPDLMSMCDLVVVPSLKEPFGRVVIEAMACGTPVVASAVDGILEIFKNGEGGLFFNAGSVSELTEKVKYFFDNPQWWELQNRKAYEHCKMNFAQEIHTSKIEEHISQVIHSRKRCQ